MREGDIIRRVTQSNFPIGQYLVITRIYKKDVWARYIDSHRAMLVGTTKDPFRVYSTKVVRISLDEYRRIKYSNPNMYRHELNKIFERLFEEQPDIVAFYATGETRIYYRTEGFSKTIYKTKLCIKIYLSQLICK